MGFYKEVGEIYRLKVPFEDLYTSVFLVKTKEGNALIDCATRPSDVDEYIIPALNEIGSNVNDIKYLVLTHDHVDHAGGKARVMEIFPNLKIIEKENIILFEDITTYQLKGHLINCIGVLDQRSKTLVTGDGLQGNGVGKYSCSLASKQEYLKTIEKLEEDERIQNLLFSHAYEPWLKDGVFGREQVRKILKDCKNI